MKTIEIKSIYGKVLFTHLAENNTIKKTLIKAINLRYANLRYADLRSADLRSADLRYADLKYANLRYADLRYANLRYANLSGADLSGADLSGADLDKKEKIRKGLIATKEMKGYKKCNELIVELEIPKGAIVFSINNNKCRTNTAKVISIDGVTTKGSKIASDYDKNFIYEVGETIIIDDFDLMYNVECSTGIHFFWERKQASRYGN